MTRNMCVLWAVLIALPACSLNRSVLFCEEGTAYEPGTPCAPIDATVTDGGMPSEDAMVMVDAWVPDGDAGPLPDAWVDPDSGTDGGTDAGPVDAGMRRCEDTTDGYCIRFQNLAGSPEVTGWMIQYIWTLPGGSIYREPDNTEPDGVAVYESACAVFRRIDARTTECEIPMPDPGMAVIGTGPFYLYPAYASGPACSSSCPAFPSGYRMWSSGMEFSTAPADGRVSQESRPTPAGTIAVLRLIP